MKVHSKKLLLIAAGTSLLAGVMTNLSLNPLLSAAALLLWLLTAPGLTVTAPFKFTSTTRVLLTGLTGPVLVFGTTVAMAWFGLWHPELATTVLCAVTLAAALALLLVPEVGERVTNTERAHAHLRPLLGAVFSLPGILITLSLAAVIASLHALPSLAANQFGLLAAAPWGPVILASNVIVVLMFAFALWRRNTYLVGYATVAFALTYRLPTAFSSEAPLYGWTYKHLGVVDYVAQAGHLANGLDVYNSWPTLFTATAWFDASTGMSALTIASWFIVFAHLAQIPAVYALGRAFSQRRLSALAAAFFAELFNWIGQDYFSPQALAFILGLYFVALLLRARTEANLIWWSLPLFALITITHQLTPYWLGLIAFGLCVFKFIKPRWFFVPLFVILGGWLALNYGSVAHYGLLSGFDPLANASRPSLGVGSLPYKLVSTSMRATALIVWGLTGLLLLRLLRRKGHRREVVLLPAILLVSPFVLLGGQSYGGEAIFRVLLYSIPACAIMLSSWVGAQLHPPATLSQYTARWRRLDKLRYLLLSLALVLFAALSLQNVYGPWFNNVISGAEYRRTLTLYKQAPTSSLFVSVSAPGAGRDTGDYVRFAKRNPSFDLSLLELDQDLSKESFKSKKALDNLTYSLENQNAQQVDIIWTVEMQHYVDYYGIYPHGAIQRLMGKLAHDPRWQPLVNNSNFKIFQLRQGE